MVFDHIGIFTPTLEKGRDFFDNLIQINRTSIIFNDVNMKVSIQFLYDQNGICYELVAPLGEFSPITNSLNTKKNILNHLAYKTNDLERDMLNLLKKRCAQIMPPQEALAFNGSKVVFFLTPLNFIIELIESKNISV